MGPILAVNSSLKVKNYVILCSCKCIQFSSIEFIAGNCRRCNTPHTVSSHYFSLHSDQNYASSCLVTYSLKYSCRYCTQYMTSHKKFITSVFFYLFWNASPFTKLLLATFYDPMAFAIKIVKGIIKNNGKSIHLHICLSVEKKKVTALETQRQGENVGKNFFASDCSSIFNGSQYT